jgi:hypothetical protein
MPSGMESWRKPVVLEKTSALKAGSASCAAAVPAVDAMLAVTAAATVATANGLPSRAMRRNRDLTVADALLVRDIY